MNEIQLKRQYPHKKRQWKDNTPKKEKTIPPCTCQKKYNNTRKKQQTHEKKKKKTRQITKRTKKQYNKIRKVNIGINMENTGFY